MSNLQVNYELILAGLQKLTKNENFYFNPIKTKLFDIEIISLITLAKFKSIDCERQLFIDLRDLILVQKSNLVYITEENSSCFLTSKN